MRIQILKYSHSFEVKTNYRQLGYIVGKFAERYEEWEWRRVKGQRAARTLVKSFVIRNEMGTQFSFHINAFDEFIKFLTWNGINESLYNVEEVPLYKPKKATMPIVVSYPPMEEQVPLIKYLIEPGFTKILTLQTGKGKTFCLLNAMSSIAVRTALIIPAKYVQRWLDDLTGKQKVLGLEETDVWIVKGGPEFARLIRAAKNKELKAKVIVFSSTTFQIYLKAFQEDPVAALKEYGCKPRDLMELLSVGLLGRDEAHEMFHFNFLVDLSIHVPKTISLSATIDFDNQMLSKMCSIMWPKSIQVNNGVWDKYIRAIGLFWKLNKPNLVKTILNGTYNHGAFETSIMKNKNLCESYLDMIEDMVESIYARGDAEDKIIVFAYTVKMCTLIADRLDEKYSGSEHKVSRYVSEDEYEVLMEGDILISTLKSAGTAVDIKNLRFVLMTTAIYSTQSNVQALGRLRKLRHKPTVAPEFYYLICKDIQKHIDYHVKKMEQFKDKVLSHETMQTGFVV